MAEEMMKYLLEQCREWMLPEEIRALTRIGLTVVAFSLRNVVDKDKIKQGDLLELRDDYIDIVDSFKLSILKVVAFRTARPFPRRRFNSIPHGFTTASILF